MSCREHPHTDWRTLIARRDESGEDPAGWDDAMARVDTCDDCRRLALMADPSLVFRRLPRVETGPADVESMRQAVASLRRASRVTAVDESGPDTTVAGSGGGARSHRAGLRQIAAAALLAAAALAAWIAGPGVLDPAALTTHDGGGEPAAVMAAAEGGVNPATSGLAGELPADGLLPPASDLAGVPGASRLGVPVASGHGVPVASRLSADDLASRPVFEGLSQPRAADVYQVGEEDLLVVMVVDETLDI